ncbi:MAG: hypothetical protein DMF62_11745 [Acidobacteria bacterium]|nr:MAG: hypothetical protein DMF62_11745 [Acidobacteriota bacterium]
MSIVEQMSEARTYEEWIALGRQVRRGERGNKIVLFTADQTDPVKRQPTAQPKPVTQPDAVW